jgi:cleavage stimulation factor subunit 2
MEALARPEANPHGPPVAPSEAPEAITQAVASLPPEQMFELMKQMKVHV